MFNNSEAFASFSTNDIEASRKFYADVLGLDVGRPGMGVLGLTLKDGGKVMIYPKGDAHQPATFTVLNFKVPNIDEAVAQLRRKNIELELYDNPEIDQDEAGVFRGKEKGHGPNIAWFKDPAGNILSILEE